MAVKVETLTTTLPRYRAKCDRCSWRGELYVVKVAAADEAKRHRDWHRTHGANAQFTALR